MTITIEKKEEEKKRYSIRKTDKTWYGQINYCC